MRKCEFKIQNEKKPMDYKKRIILLVGGRAYEYETKQKYNKLFFWYLPDMIFDQ